jgi:release factor-specific protein-(glutamine-N5) methyltransferase
MTSAEFLLGVPARARGDARWLLSSLWNCSLAEVTLNSHRAFTPSEEKTFRAWWKRRGEGEPLQYIAGSAPFWGREFLVNRHTLIPRPETEVLVEIALKFVRNGDRVLDIGTGTGCIATTLKLEVPSLHVTGSDTSAGALSLARKNARLLGAEVSFEKHDLFSPRLQKARFDIVVSNPPYLEFERDKIAAGVQKWEPRSALEPAKAASVKGIQDRASWCAERILRSCESGPQRYTLLELSPRVALALEKRWKKCKRAERVWREPDLAGRMRFLLVGWRAP